MGQFKDEHGKTRIGIFLKNLAPNLLGLVGDLTGVDALNSLSGAIQTTTDLTPEEKTKALEFVKLDLEQEKEVTKRHENDMNSDSWMSKNVRPITLFSFIFILGFVVIGAVISDRYELPGAYVLPLFTLFTPVFLFYFGGREIQKGIRNAKGKFPFFKTK